MAAFPDLKNKMAALSEDIFQHVREIRRHAKNKKALFRVLFVVVTTVALITIATLAFPHTVDGSVACTVIAQQIEERDSMFTFSCQFAAVDDNGEQMNLHTDMIVIGVNMTAEEKCTVSFEYAYNSTHTCEIYKGRLIHKPDRDYGSNTRTIIIIDTVIGLLGALVLTVEMIQLLSVSNPSGQNHAPVKSDFAVLREMICPCPEKTPWTEAHSVMAHKDVYIEFTDLNSDRTDVDDDITFFSQPQPASELDKPNDNDNNDNNNNNK